MKMHVWYSLYWLQPLCIFPLFPFESAFWCRGHMGKQSSRASTGINKVLGIWCFYFCVLPHVYRFSSDPDPAVTLDYILFHYHCTHILIASYTKWSPIWKTTKQYIWFLTTIILKTPIADLRLPALQGGEKESNYFFKPCSPVSLSKLLPAYSLDQTLWVSVHHWNGDRASQGSSLQNLSLLVFYRCKLC